MTLDGTGHEKNIGYMGVGSKYNVNVSIKLIRGQMVLETLT